MCVFLYTCAWEHMGTSWLSYRPALNKMQFVVWRWKVSYNNKRQIKPGMSGKMDEMRAQWKGKHERLSESRKNKCTLIISKRYLQIHLIQRRLTSNANTAGGTTQSKVPFLDHRLGDRKVTYKLYFAYYWDINWQNQWSVRIFDKKSF